MSKFLLAALAAAAMTGSAFAATAAEPRPAAPAAAEPQAAEPYRLDEAEMDEVSAAGLIGDINIGIVTPVQIVVPVAIATAIGDNAIAAAVNEFVARQNVRLVQRSNRRN